MSNNYKHYTDFLKDKKFIQWQLMPDETLDEYWHAFIENNPTLAQSIREASVYLKTTGLNRRPLTEKETTQLLNKIEKSVEAKTRKRNTHNRVKRKKIAQYIAYAALWMLPIIGIGVYITQQRSANTETIGVAHPIFSVSEDAPTLVLENGNRIKMIDNNKEALSAKGIELNDAEKRGNDRNLHREWRKIETPRSTTFDFELSDGTKVHMNSGTTFEYWSPFSDEERLVRIRGEAYLAVAKNTVPFRVQLNNMEINVLGTQFNVRNYAQSNSIKVTLAEGRILANAGNTDFIVESGQQIYLDKQSQQAFVKYVNVDDEISWMQDIYTFKEETLAEVSRVIEDWYNVEVVFESTKASNAAYTGIIRKEEDLRQFVQRLNISSKTIQAKIENNKLHIK